MSPRWTLLALLALSPLATGQEPAVNPHGSPTACASCHAPAEAGGYGAALPVVATCRGCHPTADMHPVGMVPNKVQVAKGFPLEDGAVVCSTCHAEPAHGAPHAALPPPFLRGGPYSRVTELCTTCHNPQAYVRTNPHTTRQGPSGSCSACHTRPPKSAALPEDAALRTAPGEACATCHPNATHAGMAEHMGRVVDATIAAKLPGPIALDQGRIACFTCHEVHDGQSGVYDTSKLSMSVLQRARAHEWPDLPLTHPWPGTQADNHLLALPLKGDALCGACHGAGP